MKKRVSIKVKTTKLSTAGGILPLVAAILFIFSPVDVHGWNPFGAGKAAKHVHLAISELNATVNKLPDQLKDTIFLFLIGLLLLGLRLFRFLEKRIAFTHLFRHSFILALISFVVIGIFLGTTLYFAINPGNLPGLSARIHHLEEEHPCQRLKIQQDHLNKAKEIGDERLITATLDRVKEAYEDCF
jgi:hypothetical protein